MKHKPFRVLAVLAVTLAAAMSLQAAGTQQTTAFTYQGQLKAGGVVSSGPYYFTFTLYDAITGPNVVGTPIQQQLTVGSGGLFTTDLDFGQIFNGQQYWLEIKVGTSAGNEQPLSARQLISAVPVAQYALNSNPPPRLLFLSSAAQAIVTTHFDGTSDTVAVLPLSGAVSSAYATTTNGGGLIDLTPTGSTPPPPPQILPVSGQFGSISAQMFLSSAVSLINPVTIQAQLYTGNLSSGIMVPQPLTCFLAPSLIGPVPTGASAGCVTSGVVILLAAGSTAVMVVSATASGFGPVNSIPMTVSVGVGP